MTGNLIKRAIDLSLAFIASVATAPIVVVLVVAATIDTRAFGLFTQRRIGRFGRPFTVFKVRSMRQVDGFAGTVTVRQDRRITRLGSIIRRLKLDELPQLWCVVTGQMSLVGPRPDMPGYADRLVGDHRRLLDLRPGVTGPATLVFRSEEVLLGEVSDPQTLNDEELWPAKVAINLAYADGRSLRDDLEIIALTVRFDRQRLERLLGKWDSSLSEIPIVQKAMAQSS